LLSVKHVICLVFGFSVLKFNLTLLNTPASK